jgi:adenylate cyclase
MTPNPAFSPRPLRGYLSAPRLSLSMAILATALGFALAITGLLTWKTMAGSTQAGREMAVKMLSLAGDHILLETAHFCQPVVQLRDTLAAIPDAAAQARGFDHPLRAAFLDALDTIPQLYSLYIAHDDGGFFQGVSLRGRPGLLRELQAPPGTMYGVRYIAVTGGVPMQAWRFYDDERKVIGETNPVKATYDPRTRPWYQGALASQAGFRTEPYVFASLKNLGVSLSRGMPATQPAVLGLDVTLASLSGFVAEQRMGASGLVYLATVSGRLIAYPDPDKLILTTQNPDGSQTLTTAQVGDLDDPLAKAVKSAFEAGGNTPYSTRELVLGDVEYMTEVMPIPILGSQHEFVALAVPSSEFIGPLQQAQRHGLLLVAALMLAAAPVMLLAARSMAKPLGELTAEAVRVSELDLNPTPAICSHIAEVDTLCRAMGVMKANFQIFGRYLPRSLMRHLHNGALATLGGQRREITLLFTDVADFTSLSEGMDPEELMQTMSDYFQGVTKAIIDSNGTIDKFIGDAVMAFWNAPSHDDGHIELACAAALRLQKATAAFNETRLAQGLPPLLTRVGVHTGEAVVGNIGTDERMDYTALGSVVNLTSRLEALNKYYGTSILASKRVRDAVNRSFLFRSADVVVPKGLAEAQATFELLGAKANSAYPEVAVSSRMLGYCSRWERAMTLYRTKQWPSALAEFAALSEMMPEDGLAKRYVRRIERLVAGDQNDDWQAAVHFTEK